MGRLSLFNVCVFHNTLHKQWSFTISVILIYHGSPDPTGRNKDKFGRLRSVCHSIMLSFEPRTQTKLTKMENGENKDLQGRREFFKEAAKKALPILGTVALLGNPVIAKAVEEPLMERPMGCTRQDCTSGCIQSCYRTCSGSCKGDCTGRCTNTCKGSCVGNCTGRCANTCKGDCQGTCNWSCVGSCSKSCLDTCTGYCSGGCKGDCYTLCYGTCSGTCKAECRSTSW